MQSRYDGSDCEWHGKEIKDIQPGDAEQVQWVRSQMAWQGDQGHTAWRCRAGMMGQIMNGMAKKSRTYSLKMQSRYNWSDREWHSEGIKGVLAEDAEQVQRVRSQMAQQKDQGHTAWRCRADMMGQIMNGTEKG